MNLMLEVVGSSQKWSNFLKKNFKFTCKFSIDYCDQSSSDHSSQSKIYKQIFKKNF